MVGQFFNLLQEKWKQYDYAPQNVYSLGEKGFLISVLQKMRRSFTKAWQEQGELEGAAYDGNRTWITLVACICAEGTSLPPALIYAATQGLCKITKAQFYKLFKPAFKKAFSKENIASDLRQTGLYPLNPAIVLDRLSTKPEPPESRPSSGGSRSQSSISLSDWGKINQVVKEAVDDILGHEGQRVIQLCHRLQAGNALLRAEGRGLKEAVHVEEKRVKALFTELRGEEGDAAIFFSLAKVSAARELQAQKGKEEEEAQAQKERDKLQRQQRKEEQAELKKAAAAARQERREHLALEKAENGRRKERLYSSDLSTYS